MPFSKRQYRPLKDVKVKTYTLHSTDKGRTKLNIEQSLHNGNQKDIFSKRRNFKQKLAKLEIEKSLTSGQDILRVLKISKFRKTEMLVPSVKVSSENQ